MNRHWREKRQCLSPAFFFVLEKAVKSAGNAVIPRFPAHCPHGLQHLRHKRPTFAFTSESGYTLAFANRIAHSGSHGETRGVSDGGGITTLRAFRTFTNIPGPGVRTAYFAALGSWPGGALEERRKPSGQRCAYACRCPEGVAAPLGCVIFFAFVEIGICTSGAHGFPRVRGMGGITTLGALCVLLKYWTVACQSGSFAIFRGQVGVVPRTIPIFLRIHRIFCWQFQLQTLLRYGTISSTNWNFQISLCKQPLNLHHQLQFPDGC